MYHSKKSVTIAERYSFYNQVPSSEESVTQFATALRQLAMNCKFERFLDQALRDKFVCGLRDSGTQKKLQSGEDKADKLTFLGALEIAVTMEKFTMGVRELETVLHTARPSITRTKVKVEDGSCFRCGKPSHKATECRFIRFLCRSSGCRDHLQAVCHSRNPSDCERNHKAPVHKVNDNAEEDEHSSDDNEVDLFQFKNKSFS
uniref:CCHC-type domain-containing protein n=1 Tax=Amphimedon queenslandica TaxID=400682 RepID=A0A1X7VIJ0_AMPQE